jgi:hypothetical protein
MFKRFNRIGVLAAGWGLASLLLSSPLAAQKAGAPAVVRAEFKIANRPVDAVAPLLRPHLSVYGELHIQPQRHTLTVVDLREKVDAVERLVKEYDVPLMRVEIVAKLIEASGEKPQEDVSEAIRDIGSRLRNVLRFSSYKVLDTAVMEGLEGYPMSVAMAGSYRLDCRLGYFLESGKVIPMERFRLDRRNSAKPEGDSAAYQVILSTALNLLDGEEVMLGASRAEPGSDKALVLVLRASVRRGQ